MGIGPAELIVIFIVALIVFGPRKLPEIGRAIGKGIAELRKVMDGHLYDLKEEISENRESDEEKATEQQNKDE